MIRTREAGTLRAADAGTTVTLAGWVARRRDHGGVTFLDLRDGSGVVQVVVRDMESVHDLRNEYCVAATGEVRPRPEGNANPDLATCIVGSANPANVKKWADWAAAPVDRQLLAEVREILAPIHNWFYVEGRPENNDEPAA